MHPSTARYSLALGACAALMGGCGQGSPADEPTLFIGSTAQPIQGGYVDEVDKSVVGIAIFVSGGIAGCSGSLIAPNVVLTAHHCVAPTNGGPGGAVLCGQSTFGAPYAASDLLVTTDTTMPFMPASYIAGAEVVLPTQDNAFCGNDQAIIILSQPIDGAVATPLVPRVDVPLGSDEIYSAVGYGQTYDSSTAPSGTRYRRDDLQVWCVGDECGTSAVATAEWVGETAVCSGDSGGPAIDAAGRVTGVASRGSAGCETPVYGHVPSWGEWIKQTTVYAAGLMGVDPPPWATGWPTDPAYSMPVGDACELPEQCPSGICQNGYCTRPCNELAPCPGGWGCKADGAVCERRFIPAPEGGSSDEASGCSVASPPHGGGDDPTEPIPWALGGALAALRMGRRRSRRSVTEHDSSRARLARDRVKARQALG